MSKRAGEERRKNPGPNFNLRTRILPTRTGAARTPSPGGTGAAAVRTDDPDDRDHLRPAHRVHGRGHRGLSVIHRSIHHNGRDPPERLAADKS